LKNIPKTKIKSKKLKLKELVSLSNLGYFSSSSVSIAKGSKRMEKRSKRPVRASLKLNVYVEQRDSNTLKRSDFALPPGVEVNMEGSND
jgi:hypothetical protein